jgi:hypothetical protein
LARLEKAEFDRLAAAARADREREKEAMLKRERENAAYRQHLKADMEENRVRRQMQPLIQLDERKHLEETNNDYLEKLERIRQMKLNMLRSEGVPDKYLADLQRMRFVLK